MGLPTLADTDAQIAFLEAEERLLESQLAELRSSLATLKAQQHCLASPQEGMRAPLYPNTPPTLPAMWNTAEPAGSSVPQGHSPNPAISLQSLHPHDPLHAKWKLGRGMSTATSRFAPLPSLPTATRAFNQPKGHGRQLRLAGKLGGGRPWECRIPFATLARPEGMTMGRAPHEADIVLPDDSASRRHALLEITEGGLVITDLGSTNGTYLNNRLLSPYERRAPLQNGTFISIGETQLRVEYI